jgi:hypothetical protein
VVRDVELHTNEKVAEFTLAECVDHHKPHESDARGSKETVSEEKKDSSGDST